MIGPVVAVVLAWPRPVPLRIEPPEQIGALTVFAGAGDVDGDGTEDLIVGAPGTTVDGWVGLWAGGPRPEVLWRHPGARGEGLGMVVAGIGDVDCDGLSDIAIAVPDDPAGGRVEVYLGDAAGPGAEPDELYRSGPGYGGAVAGVGDLDGDRCGELAIATGDGRVIVHRGASAGPWAEVLRDVPGRELGWAGDLDGDGLAELVVGDDDGVRVHRSSGEVATFEPGAFAGAGDMDGDGRSDLAIARAGEVVLVRWDVASSALVSGALGVVGERVAAAGDMNGDGYADLVVMRDGKAAFVIGGALSEITALALPGDARGVGDLDGDGFGDVAFGGAGDHLSLIRGAGTALGTEPVKLVTPHDNSAPATADMFALDGVDLDADGASEVVVGMRTADIGAGRADVFGGHDLARRWSWSGKALGDGYGTQVANGGDVDGDGYADLWIAAPFARNGNLVEAGYLELQHGGPDSPTSGLSLVGGTNDRLGAHLGGSGDLNGDGRAELAFGSGDLSIHFGGAVQRSLLVLQVLDMPSALRNPMIGDVDGDGRDEVVTDGANNLGRVVAWVVDGALEHVVVPPDAVQGIEANAGDVDGDGDVEMLESNAHTPCALELTQDRMAALVEGAPGFLFEPRLVLGRGSICLGAALDGAGDVDGDGKADVIVGAPAGAGAVFLHLGTAEGLAPTPAWTVVGDRDTRNLGIAVAGAGDIDGDGFGDVVIAGRLVDGGDPNDALVHVYFGNGALGTRSAWRYGVAARQPLVRSPLAVGGRSLEPRSFGVRGVAASPFARRARLEVEAKRFGVPFDGRGLAVSDWGVAGAELFVRVEGLAADTGYAWRARLRAEPSAAPPQAASHWIYGGRPGEGRAVHVRTRTNAAPTAGLFAKVLPPGSFIAPAPGVIARASDPDGDALTARVGRPPVHGVAAIDEKSGKLEYRPDPGFSGVERFTYVVSDGLGGEAEGDVELTVPGPLGCGLVSDDECAQGEVFLVVRKADGSNGSVHCTIRGDGVPDCDKEADETLRIGEPACGFF